MSAYSLKRPRSAATLDAYRPSSGERAVSGERGIIKFYHPDNTTMTAPAARTLAEFATALKYEAIPQEAIDRAKTSIIDTVGAMTFGASQPWSRIMVGPLRDAVDREAQERTGAYGRSARFRRHALAAAQPGAAAGEVSEGDRGDQSLQTRNGARAPRKPRAHGEHDGIV